MYVPGPQDKRLMGNGEKLTYSQGWGVTKVHVT